MTESVSPTASVQVTEVVDGCSFRGLPLVVFTFTLAALVFDGFDIQAVGFVAPALLEEWNITRRQLTPVLAAAMLGMALGAAFIGPIGDRFGRRNALMLSMGVVAVGSLLSAYADTPGELIAYRLITGLGLGGSLPNATSLTVELVPLTVRNLVVSITVVGVPIGGMLGAEAAAQLLPAFGWRVVFVAGAILPSLLVLAMWLWMPESPRYLARRPERSNELARMLNRLTHSNRYHARDRFVIAERASSARHEGLRALLTSEYRADTLLLWTAFFTSLFSVYALFNWLPTVLSGVGLPITVALRCALVLNLGCVFGALILAPALNRYGSRKTLLLFSALGAGLAFVLGGSSQTLYRPDDFALLLVLMFAAGATVLSVQVGLYSVSAYAYPTSARASGVGAALGVGRVGGIASAFAGGIVTSISEGAAPFFAGIGLVVLLMATAIALFKRHMPPVRTLN
jgi:AAHS family 4-hydroxybenzoate transporter-like MFS transporter